MSDEPVAWRWRNPSGDWWYLDREPKRGEGYIGPNAEIEPLYRHPKKEEQS